MYRCAPLGIAQVSSQEEGVLPFEDSCVFLLAESIEVFTQVLETERESGCQGRAGHSAVEALLVPILQCIGECIGQ